MPLKRTSMQLSDEQLEYLAGWPGLPVSEALRVVLDRYQFLAAGVDVSRLAERHRKILTEALNGLGFGDFKVIARSLPALLASAPAELRQWVEKATALERVALADAVVRSRGERKRKRV
jgi:hypothetical protein